MLLLPQRLGEILVACEIARPWNLPGLWAGDTPDV